MPQVPSALVLQVAPEQQPSGHVVELQPSHTPPLHAAPPQLSQSAPPAPHCVELVPGSHVLPLQQPSHDAPSHTQTPASQRWPIAHCAPAPHRHVPPLHESDRSRSQVAHIPPGDPHAASEITRHTLPLQQPVGQEVESHTQLPPRQRCPGPHAGLAPHWHVPLAEQPFAMLEEHSTQVEPATPHVSAVRTRHSLPSQHPAGHEV